MLRVFSCDDQSQYYDALPEEVNMRFLEDRSYKDRGYLLPSLLSRFWTLQTLIVTVENEVVAPIEIWKMLHLRHIDIRNLCLPDPPSPQSDEDMHVLENLHTLKNVQNLTFTEEVCRRIPNVKEISITCDRPCYHLENLGCFNKLEWLYCGCNSACDSLQNIKFPSSLKDLALYRCKFEWSYMAVIASLPHLQSMTLSRNAFAGTEWVFVDERFVSLKHLNILNPGPLTKWIAQSSNFPVLENLVLFGLTELDEIPLGIGEIPTLQSIILCHCSESLNISAVKILYEQQRFENLGLHISIGYVEPELLREKIEELDLTCQNLAICCESYLFS